MHAASTVDFTRTDLMNLRILISEYKLWRPSLWNFLCKFFISLPSSESCPEHFIVQDLVPKL